MKKIICVLLTIALSASLLGCSSILVDLNTPKSSELSKKYDYYDDSMGSIYREMKVSPEQADEIFIILTECGLDEKITNISEKKNDDKTYYKVDFGNKMFEVYLNNCVVDTIMQKGDMLYPEKKVHNFLMDYKIKVKDIKKKGKVVGQYAYIKITKEQLNELTDYNLKEFAEKRVADSKYNWLTIECEDGTGIIFGACNTLVLSYGKLDSEKRVEKTFGNYYLDENGNYYYEEISTNK